MTIIHNGNTVSSQKTVGAKGALRGFFSGGLRTINLELLPNSDDSFNDAVKINTNNGSREIIGRAIISNPTCQENGITWSPFSSKER